MTTDNGDITAVNAIRNITVDCARPYELALFWSRVVGWPLYPEDGPDDNEVGLRPPTEGHPILLFIGVPEAKTVKNRLHLDLQPLARTRDEEVERVVGLGAKIAEDHRRPDGTGWVTMVDPEGNEFCIERSTAERAATAS